MPRTWPWFAAVCAFCISPALAQESPTLLPPVAMGEAPSSERVRGGVAFYFFTPNFKNDPAYIINTSSGNRIAPDFSYGVSLSPSAWVEIVDGDGFGWRLRYFQFSDGAREYSRVYDATQAVTDLRTGNPLGIGLVRPAGTLASTERLYGLARLNLLTWDFDATTEYVTSTGRLGFGLGGRYLHLSSDYVGYIGAAPPPPPPAATPATPTIVATNVISGHNFNGAGPTASFDFVRNFGDTGWGIYGSARGGLVFGYTHHSAQASTTSSLAGVVTTTTQVKARTDHITIPLGEFEIGTQNSRLIGRVELFTQLGFAANIWGNVGNASASNADFSPQNNHTLSLYGFVVRVGLGF